MKLGPRCAVLASVLLFAFASLATAGVRDDHPNLVGAEVLGRGIVLTLNYERFLTNHFGVGGGIMTIGGSNGLITLVPMYASVLTGDTHSLYLGAGGTLVNGTGEIFNFDTSWLLHASIGYQYQSPGGFFVRPFFSIIGSTVDDSNGFIVWPGVTLGGSF
jgi:hypothetical protein